MSTFVPSFTRDLAPSFAVLTRCAKCPFSLRRAEHASRTCHGPRPNPCSSGGCDTASSPHGICVDLPACRDHLDSRRCRWRASRAGKRFRDSSSKDGRVGSSARNTAQHSIVSTLAPNVRRHTTQRPPRASHIGVLCRLVAYSPLEIWGTEINGTIQTLESRMGEALTQKRPRKRLRELLPRGSLAGWDTDSTSGRRSAVQHFATDGGREPASRARTRLLSGNASLVDERAPDAKRAES